MQQLLRTSAINARRLAGVFLLVWLAGCATPQTDALLSRDRAELPPRIELDAVPYYPQEAFQCGPAALAMVLQNAGRSADPDALAPQVYLPGRQGSLQIELQAAARRHDLLAYPLAPRLQDLLTEVAAGTPALVLQNLGFNWYPVWHYAVVIGYDLEQRTLLLRSGPERRQVLPLTTFEHTWARGGHWALLALPPGQLPRTATPERYLDAAVALETTGRTASARRAYAAASARWPEQLAAAIGLGNTAYAEGDFAAAEQAFRAATVAHPDAAVAFNNLADTLLQQRRYQEALAAAEQAVRLGGPQQAVFAATLAEIRAHLQERKIPAQ